MKSQEAKPYLKEQADQFRAVLTDLGFAKGGYTRRLDIESQRNRRICIAPAFRRPAIRVSNDC